MNLGLVMIVKDEADKIRDTLKRVKPIVSSYTILDTGSTDGTITAVRRAMKGVTGTVHRGSFHGFAATRTRALQLAQGTADYLLMLDADHTLHVEGEMPELTADSYLLRVRSGIEWRLPLLTRAAHPFEYRGAAHAYLASDMPHTEESLDWLWIEGGGGVTRDKLERDLEALTAEHARNPLDPRTTFYLAQTYKDLDRPHEAIHFYRLRASMNGFPEERYVARYELGSLLSEHVEFRQGAQELLAAWQERPSRVEALRALANAASSVADKAPLPEDVLFVQPSAYRKVAA